MGVCDTHVKTENVRTTGIEMAGMNEKKKKKWKKRDKQEEEERFT